MSRQTSELTCIVCPVGCRLRATIEDGQLVEVQGNSCRRGATYALDELCAPKRTVTSTVRVDGGFLPLVPVRTSEPVPKDKISQVLLDIARIKVKAPVRIHQVVAADVAGTGIDIIASRSMGRANAPRAE